MTADKERDLDREAKLEQQLAVIDPSLTAPFHQARLASERGDFAESVCLLEPVCAAAPDFDAAQRRLGVSLARSSRRAEALPHGEKAVAIAPSAANLSSLAYIVAFAEGHQPTQDDKQRAYSLLQGAEVLPDGKEAQILVPLASLALERDDQITLRRVTQELQKVSPELMQTHYFAAIVATVDEHWVKAKKEIRRAGALGLPAAGVQEFLDTGVGWRALLWQLTFGTLWAAGLWAAGLLLLFLFGSGLSRITLRHIEKGDAALAVTPAEARLRRIYRAVLNFAGIYYYLSLPIVLALVIAVCAAVLSLCLSLGHIPIKLVLMLVIGALATIWSMVRSLFVRLKASDPGRVLERSEAEDLWRLAEEVAAELKTRPVDEIRIAGGTQLCVYERGTWREKLHNRAQRVLVLGTALIPGFQLEDFRCVLGHEYGHFAHRDTAGGDVALRVQNDMVKFYYAMRAAGQATKLNLAFQFLRLYDFLFRRISHGATRLQEVLADRVAAQAYGAAAFEGGLRHVIRQGVSFELRANREIKDAIEGARPLRNLYDLPASEAKTEEDAYVQAIERPTTFDDTHPGPKDRFRYLAKVVPPLRAVSAGEVWSLFRDPAAVMQELVSEIEKNVAPHRREPLATA